jgi:hypothetical protein
MRVLPLPLLLRSCCNTAEQAEIPVQQTFPAQAVTIGVSVGIHYLTFRPLAAGAACSWPQWSTVFCLVVHIGIHKSYLCAATFFRQVNRRGTFTNL